MDRAVRTSVGRFLGNVAVQRNEGAKPVPEVTAKAFR
jgi:hypothetical protein